MRNQLAMADYYYYYYFYLFVLYSHKYKRTVKDSMSNCLSYSLVVAIGFFFVGR